MAGQQKTTTGFEDLMSNPAGQNQFFEYLKNNKAAADVFNSLLSEFQKGMGLQNQVAQVRLGNAAVAAAGFRPGQYVSERQRREAIAFARDPEAAQADNLARLQFHGGMANGRWITNYDEWKAAGDKQHTDSNGKPIEVRSFGMKSWNRKPLTAEDTIQGTVVKDKNGNDVVMKGSPGDVVRGMARLAGDYRGVRRDRDGSIVYTFGGDGNRADVRREALRMLSLYDGKTDRQREAEWMFGDDGRLKSNVVLPRSASKGGETMRERGWLDAVFARAEGLEVHARAALVRTKGMP